MGLLLSETDGAAGEDQPDEHRAVLHRSTLRKDDKDRERTIERHLNDHEVRSGRLGDVQNLKKHLRRVMRAAVLEEEVRLQTTARTIGVIAKRVEELRQPSALLEMIASKLADGDLDYAVEEVCSSSGAATAPSMDMLMFRTRNDDFYADVAQSFMNTLLE